MITVSPQNIANSESKIDLANLSPEQKALDIKSVSRAIVSLRLR